MDENPLNLFSSKTFRKQNVHSIYAITLAILVAAVKGEGYEKIPQEDNSINEEL